ncbi:LysR family transcriptional regulator [Salinisphaera hydrothermalis]|uniref:LysR family transcriptional regulator n=1 Tax=Salinisphaera hydrothermalis (strain C41B8) TaxID=1304275 RepID=A0A084ILN4_SALHC|nr:LysR family transcriptional regulator [Salinisphaera hydrothermalis]KEZ77618.1 LysR family transcriptional regulator [Salinisphaera hydrothermalis C41B8]
MKRNLDLNALRTFRLVVDSGGFTAAAHRSHRAVSSVSRQIAALERGLGQTLFYRHTRAVELTEAGARYLEAIRPLLDQLDTTTETVFEQGNEPSGVLTINAPVAFGERQVVPLVHGFIRQYPKLKTELRLTDRFVDPVRSGSDITFRVGRLEDSSLIARRLGPMQYVLAAAPAYLAGRREPTHPEHLLDHDCLRYQGDYGRQRWFWRERTDTDFERLDIDGSLYSDDATSLRAAALLGQGIVLFPTWLIDRELASGELRPILTDWQWEVAPEDRAIHLLYSAARLRPPKIQAFVDHVLQTVGDPPVWDRWRPSAQPG